MPAQLKVVSKGVALQLRSTAAASTSLAEFLMVQTFALCVLILSVFASVTWCELASMPDDTGHGHTSSQYTVATHDDEHLEDTPPGAPLWRCKDVPSVGLSSYCFYRDSLCLDVDGDLILMDDSKPAGERVPVYDGQASPLYAGQFVAIQTWRIGPKDTGLPFRSFLNARYENSEYASRTNAEWLSGSTVIASFDSPSHNIFHWAYKVLVGWFVHLRVLEESPQLFHPTISVFERAIINRTEAGMSEWQRGLLHATFGSGTAVEYIFARPKEQLWTLSGVFANGADDRNSDGHTARRPVCFREAFTLGTDNALFVGPEDAELFRRRVSDVTGVQMDTFSRGGFYKDVKDLSVFETDGYILYVKRSNPPLRKVHNEDAFVELIKDVTKRPIRVVTLEGLPFRDQVELFAGAVVVIAPHGAALTNSIFLPTGAAVIELNPAKYAFELYHYVALNSGHFYFRFTATVEDTVFFAGMEESGCKWYSTRMAMDSQCQPYARDGEITVDLVAFKRLLNEVMELVIFAPPLT